MQDPWDVSVALQTALDVTETSPSGSVTTVTYTHVTVPPVERDLDVPPVVADLLAVSDGAALFGPTVVDLELDGGGLAYEAIIFDAAEIREETQRLRGQLLDEIEEIADDLEELAGEPRAVAESGLRRSIGRLWAIGRTLTGDSLVIEEWGVMDICVFAHHFLISNIVWPDDVVRCDGLEGLFQHLADRLAARI